MSAEEAQLKSIDVGKFKIITINETVYLSLPNEDIQAGGACECGDKFRVQNILSWLKDWNIEQLIELEISPGASYTSRQLNVVEAEFFETARNRLFRCKRYALNYYENSLFEKFEA